MFIKKQNNEIKLNLKIKKIKKIKSFLGRYFFSLSRCLFIHTIGVFSQKNREIVTLICTHLDYGKITPLIPKIELPAILDTGVNIHLSELIGDDGNVTLTELACISNLIQQKSPQRIFEIGTFNGRTTLNMAYNSPESSKIYTLDLPKEALSSTKLPIGFNDKQYINKESSGTKFLKRNLNKIVQLFGDSANFNFSSFLKKMDFIFIDGSHSYDYVLSDSKIAAKLLNTDGGIILWHDYDTNYWPGVTKALNELYAQDPYFQELKHIKSTSLVYLFKRKSIQI